MKKVHSFLLFLVKKLWDKDLMILFLAWTLSPLVKLFDFVFVKLARLQVLTIVFVSMGFAAVWAFISLLENIESVLILEAIHWVGAEDEVWLSTCSFWDVFAEVVATTTDSFLLSWFNSYI